LHEEREESKSVAYIKYDRHRQKRKCERNERIQVLCTLLALSLSFKASNSKNGNASLSFRCWFFMQYLFSIECLHSVHIKLNVDGYG